MAYANRAARAVVVIATGVLVIAAAYAAGRAGTAGAGHEAAIAGSWLGEALIFAPPTVLVLSAAEPGARASDRRCRSSRG